MERDRLKVLIVDDEYRIGMLIKKLIDWQELNLELVAAVNSGQEAMEQITAKAPDIVITDIRMPEISGLDLIASFREQCRFIVISGYKEFEYAQKALQYGVEDYLLKPVNGKELNQVLAKLVNQIRNEARYRIKTQKLIAKSENIIKREYLNNVLELQQDQQPDTDCEYLNLTSDMCYRVFKIKLDYRDCDTSDPIQDKITINDILAMVNAELDKKVKEYVTVDKAHMSIYGFISYGLDQDKEVQALMNRLMAEIQSYLLKFELFVVTVGVSLLKSDIGQIRTGAFEAETAIDMRIFWGIEKVIYYNVTSSFRPIDRLASYFEEMEQMMEQAPEQNAVPIFSDIIERLFVELLKSNQYNYYQVAVKIVKMIFDRAPWQLADKQQLQKEIMEHCHHMYSRTKLKELLKTEITDFFERCLSIQENEKIKPVRQAMDFIADNYRQKITLEDIATIVALNPVYFSVLFKKETGQNISNYIINVRMEKAKQILKTTNKTIAAVADEVGYKNSRYFSQTFTKVVGIKPALYRKIYS